VVGAGLECVMTVDWGAGDTAAEGQDADSGRWHHIRQYSAPCWIRPQQEVCNIIQYTEH